MAYPLSTTPRIGCSVLRTSHLSPGCHQTASSGVMFLQAFLDVNFILSSFKVHVVIVVTINCLKGLAQNRLPVYPFSLDLFILYKVKEEISSYEIGPYCRRELLHVTRGVFPF